MRGRAVAEHGRSFMLHGVSRSGLLFLPLFVKKVFSIQRVQDFKCQRAVEVDAERNENANRSIHVLRVVWSVGSLFG